MLPVNKLKIGAAYSTYGSASQVNSDTQGSHKLWKSWKTWKIRKKSSMHGKIMEFEKTLNNLGKIIEFCEII